MLPAHVHRAQKNTDFCYTVLIFMVWWKILTIRRNTFRHLHETKKLSISWSDNWSTYAQNLALQNFRDEICSHLFLAWQIQVQNELLKPLMQTRNLFLSSYECKVQWGIDVYRVWPQTSSDLRLSSLPPPTLCNDVLSTSWKGEGSIRISSISIGLSISASSHALICGSEWEARWRGWTGAGVSPQSLSWSEKKNKQKKKTGSARGED